MPREPFTLEEKPVTRRLVPCLSLLAAALTWPWVLRRP